MSTGGRVPASRCGGRPAAPEPEFDGAWAPPVRYAAAPMLMFNLQVSGAERRQVYMIALTIQVMIEPARRGDADTRERLVELFRGLPSAGRSRPEASLLGPARRGCASVGRVDDESRADHSVTTTWRSRRRSTCTRLSDGEAPLTAEQRRRLLARATTAGSRWCSSPGHARSPFRMPVSPGRETIKRLTEHRLGGGAVGDPRGARAGTRRARRTPHSMPRVAELLGARCAVAEALERAGRLPLWEGSRSIRTRREPRRTPRRRPFGMVYPPAYASGSSSSSTPSSCRAWRRPRARRCWPPRCASWRPPEADGAVRRLALPPSPAADVALEPRVVESRVSAGSGAPPLVVGLRLATSPGRTGRPRSR